MFTRAMTAHGKRVTRSSSALKTQVCQEPQRVKYPYISSFGSILKHGSSADPERRVTDKHFGKCPKQIRNLVKHKRTIDTIFVPTTNDVQSGDTLERKFHTKNEHNNIVGEYYPSSIRSKITAFYKRHGYKPVKVKISN